MLVATSRATLDKVLRDTLPSHESGVASSATSIEDVPLPEGEQARIATAQRLLENLAVEFPEIDFEIYPSAATQARSLGELVRSVRADDHKSTAEDGRLFEDVTFEFKSEG